MRRDVVVCILSVTLLALTGCQAVESWPAGRSDPGNSGFNAGETKLSLATAPSLTMKYRADIGQVDGVWSAPVVAGGSVFVAARGVLEVFSASAETCTTNAPSPPSCTTLASTWTADLGGRRAWGTPTVDHNTVYLSTLSVAPALPGNLIFAFDARGQTGCGGTPRVCQPLWTAAGGWHAPLAVRAGRVYAIDGQSMRVFDANGVDGCSGSPKVCAPLWSTLPVAPPNGSVNDLSGMAAPTVSDSTVFLEDVHNKIYAYDATGVDGCTGVPIVCSPRWTATTVPSNFTPAGTIVSSGANLGWTAPVLDGSRLITYTAVVSRPDGTESTLVAAYDAHGVAGCAGTPVACQPEWSVVLPGEARDTQLTVAYGTVYVLYGAGKLAAIADDGSPGCVGYVPTCPAKWTNTGSASLLTDWFFPVVANGAVYVPSASGVAVFDAHGSTNCMGRTPTMCQSTDLSSRSTTGGVTAVDNGNISVSDGKLYMLATTGVATGPDHIHATLVMYG